MAPPSWIKHGQKQLVELPSAISVKVGARGMPLALERLQSGYLTGIIMCSYDVPPHMMNGLLGSSGDLGRSPDIPAIPTTITCGPVVTHFFPGGGAVANGSSLLASDPPCSI